MLHFEFLLIIHLIGVETQNFVPPATCESVQKTILIVCNTFLTQFDDIYSFTVNKAMFCERAQRNMGAACIAVVLGQFAASNLPPAIRPPQFAPDAIKFLNEKCRFASECYGYPDTMTCQNQICVCKDGYQPTILANSQNGSRVCTAVALGLGEVCYDSCQKPLVCKSSQTDGYDGLGYRLEGTSTCQCLAPYFLDQKNVCTMKCKSNQKYDPYTATCLQICRSTEVSIDGNCKATIHCPTGAVLTRGNIWVGCKVVVEPFNADYSLVRPTPFHQPYHTFRDNCTSGYFCLPTDWPPTNQTSGYCCPMLRLNCPIGQPLVGASCDHAPISTFTTTAAANTCPSETHFCFPVDLGGRVTGVCCPRACSSVKMMQVNGRCYVKAHLDESCQINEQCVDSQSVCNRGICSCPKGYVASTQPDTQDKACRADCQYNQVEYGGSCVAALKLGQPCRNEPWRCPQNAKCGMNRVCVCLCPYVPLDNAYICAANPSCNQFQGDSSNVFDNWSVVAPSITNIVFCALTNQKYRGPLKVVNQCPYYQYCSPYLSDVDQTCPDGNYSTGPCQTDADCGSSNDQYCNKIKNSLMITLYNYFKIIEIDFLISCNAAFAETATAASI
uniref:EB domain-containing protein n=1 Tax=Romanomermis culicivorax TaxID=13658 RepID=A0A915KV43_ROMCU